MTSACVPKQCYNASHIFTARILNNCKLASFPLTRGPNLETYPGLRTTKHTAICCVMKGKFKNCLVFLRNKGLKPLIYHCWFKKFNTLLDDDIYPVILTCLVNLPTTVAFCMLCYAILAKGRGSCT